MSYMEISTAKNVYFVVVLICYHWVKNKLPSIFPNILLSTFDGAPNSSDFYRFSSKWRLKLFPFPVFTLVSSAWRSSNRPRTY